MEGKAITTELLRSAIEVFKKMMLFQLQFHHL